MGSMNKNIEIFLSAPAIAVIGASEDPDKYGHKCYACLLNHGLKAYPVNPRARTILGNPAYPDLASLPEKVESISVITPPSVTEKIMHDAIALGVKNVWMQPGAESRSAIENGLNAGLNIIAEGPCLLVELGLRKKRS